MRGQCICVNSNYEQKVFWTTASRPTSHVNDVDRRSLRWACIFVSSLKHYYNFSITFSVILISISGTGKVPEIDWKKWAKRKTLEILYNVMPRPVGHDQRTYGTGLLRKPDISIVFTRKEIYLYVVKTMLPYKTAQLLLRSVTWFIKVLIFMSKML